MKPLFYLSVFCFLPCVPLQAVGEPKIEALKPAAEDVLFLSRFHGWKWRYTAASPYKLLTVRVMQYTRTAQGGFEAHELSKGLSLHALRATDDVMIVCGAKEVRGAFFDTYGMAEFKYGPASGISLAGYTRLGGDGAPVQVGSEHLLMVHYKEDAEALVKGKGNLNKNDMGGYVSVEFEVK